ncbi:MAG: oligopeptide/dipeptide ABC transporter ATP-binding protein, partial [Sciscionella sp.]
ERLRPISGQPPSLIGPPQGCPFHPRCPYVMDRCATDPPPLAADETGAFERRSACWLPFDLTGTGPAPDAARAQVAAWHRTRNATAEGGAP